MAYRQVPRDQTATYARMQKACFELTEGQDLVVVNSFNEFHENTHIEPSEMFGSAYVEATRNFSDSLKLINVQDLDSTAGLAREVV